MKFIGVDLGWSSGPTGLSSLYYQNGDLTVVDLDRRLALPEILQWIDDQFSADPASVPIPGGIAVDAPTLIPNLTGMRLPDRLTHQYFGRYDAGCYPANQGRPFAQRTVEFGLSLEARGFNHAPEMFPKVPIRFQIEVFPHPAAVQLFGLSKILKYKRGKLCDRCAALGQFREYLSTVLPMLEPRLKITESDLPAIPSTGPALKAVEDQLDSLLCAYVAAYWWYWGTARNLVLGNRDAGYIVIPQGVAHKMVRP